MCSSHTAAAIVLLAAVILALNDWQKRSAV